MVAENLKQEDNLCASPSPPTPPTILLLFMYKLGRVYNKRQYNTNDILTDSLYIQKTQYRWSHLLGEHLDCINNGQSIFTRHHEGCIKVLIVLVIENAQLAFFFFLPSSSSSCFSLAYVFRNSANAPWLACNSSYVPI